MEEEQTTWTVEEICQKAKYDVSNFWKRFWSMESPPTPSVEIEGARLTARFTWEQAEEVLSATMVMPEKRKKRKKRRFIVPEPELAEESELFDVRRAMRYLGVFQRRFERFCQRWRDIKHEDPADYVELGQGGWKRLYTLETLDEMKELFLAEGWTVIDVAGRYAMSRQQVHNLIRAAGIHPIGQKEGRLVYSPRRMAELMEDRGRTVLPRPPKESGVQDLDPTVRVENGTNGQVTVVDMDSEVGSHVD